MTAWLTAYLLTVAIEMPIWARGFRRVFPSGWALIALAFGTSLLTHPLLWLTFEPGDSFASNFLIAEGSVAFAEGLLVWALWSWRGKGEASVARCFLVSILANATSSAVGLFLWL